MIASKIYLLIDLKHEVMMTKRSLINSNAY